MAVDPLAHELTLTVEAPGYLPLYVQAPLPPDGRLEVRLQGVSGAISCRLVDEGGAPVLDGFVFAWVNGFGAAGTSEPEPDGIYRIGDVPVGRAIVTAGHDKDLPLARGEVDVRAHEVSDLGTLVFRSPRALCGRVTDMTGRPVGGAQLYAVEGNAEAKTYSRSDGSFRLFLPPWFDDFVLASKPGYGSVHRRAVEPLDLVLPPEGKVRLEVRMRPIRGGSRGWSISARDPSTGLQWRHMERHLLEGTTYLVSGLPPGRLVLVVETSPRNGEVEVVVVAGETVPAVIELPE